jgi:phosphoglycolate phosphatase-like HAD superfamily hydrolase
VLSNNPSEFVDLILESLGIKSLFSAVFGMKELNFFQKPDKRAFKILENYLQQGKRIVFIDDELNNILAAKAIGCTTVLVGGQYSKQEAPDYLISSLI